MRANERRATQPSSRPARRLELAVPAQDADMDVVASSPAIEPPGVTADAWIRNRRRTRAWAVVALLLSLAFAGSAFLPGHLPSHADVVAAVIFAVIYLGVLAGGIALARRIATAGVWIGATGIVVRGPFRTWVVAPDEAGEFAPGLQGAGGNGVPCPLLSRADRRAVGVWALGRRNIWFRYQRICQEIEPLCAELNALIARVQSPAPPA